MRPLAIEARLEHFVGQCRPLRIAVDDRLAGRGPLGKLLLRRQDRCRLKRARGEFHVQRRQWAARFDGKLKAQHDAVLEIAIRAEQHERRHGFVAKPLPQPDEEFVGNRRRVKRVQAREHERLTIRFWPARRVAGQRLEDLNVGPGAFQVRQRISFGVGATIGMGDDPAHLARSVGSIGLLVRCAASSSSIAAAVRGNVAATAFAQDGSGWPLPFSAAGKRRQASSSESIEKRVSAGVPAAATEASSIAPKSVRAAKLKSCDMNEVSSPWSKNLNE